MSFKLYLKLFCTIFLFFPFIIFGQTSKNVNIIDLHRNDKLRAVNREIQIVSKDNLTYLHIIEGKEEGIIWLPLKEFRDGTIEVVMRGKDVLQQSFIGLVFNGLNDSIYDAVYCRPFNFFSKDSIRKIHAIQYISHPVYTWEKLRKERNAVYEKEILNPPNPNDWFSLKLIISGTTIKAYVNNEKFPSLVVEKLNIRKTGRIGLFTGAGSGGDFKELKVNYKQ